MTARVLPMLAALACGSAPPTTADLTARHATAADVQAILARDCAVGGCHLRAPGAGGLVLAGDWRRALVGVPAQQHPAMALVAAGAPERSWLIAKLGGACAGDGCGDTMPPGEPLSAADRATIAAWIRDGAR